MANKQNFPSSMIKKKLEQFQFASIDNTTNWGIESSVREISKGTLPLKRHSLTRLGSGSFFFAMVFKVGCGIAVYLENVLYVNNLLQKALNACPPD